MPTITHKRVTWIDLTNPKPRDLAFLKREHHVHENPLREISVESATPKIESYKDQLYLVLFFPFFDPIRKTTIGREIDFIITKRVLITAHYDPIAPLEILHRACGISGEARNECFSETSANLLFIILSYLYDYLTRELSHIKKKIDFIDNALFRANERNLARRILEIRQDILNFKRTLNPQRQIIESLAERGSRLLGKKSKESFQDLFESYDRISNMLESHKEAIEALHETNISLLSTRQNDTIQTLTKLSVVTFYLMLVAAVFSTDAAHKPIVGAKYDFWIILGIMAGTLLLLLAFFRHKRWM